MIRWSDGLLIEDTSLYLDSRLPRDRCIISHAHSDHIACHQQAIATNATAALLRKRVECADVLGLNFGEKLSLQDGFQLRLHPAGHVLGSAMSEVIGPRGTLLYTGDFKLRDSLTAETPRAIKADVLVMECTYGLPMFRFPPRQQIAEQLIELATAALAAGRQPIVMGYSLGKAQEIVRILTNAGLPVTVHGAVATVNRVYESLGTDVGPWRAYRYEDFHGSAALDLKERGVLVAPPNVARSGFVTRFENPCRIILTGWAILKNAIYRYGVDHALPFSDHADFDELLELIERVNPKKIFAIHGYREFCDTLTSRGLDAQWAEPAEQMLLFE